MNDFTREDLDQLKHDIEGLNKDDLSHIENYIDGLNSLPRAIELECLHDFNDVRVAFERRGYKDFVINFKKNKYIITTNIKNNLDETINYRFEHKIKSCCYLEAAGFLEDVQEIRKEYGLGY